MFENCERRLQTLAQAAAYHAFEQHGIQLDDHSIDLLDSILCRERAAESHEDYQTLVLVYGAWLGQWAVENVGGCWVGLFEPTPPRIIVNGVPTSPMDAVHRRLVDEQSPSIQSMTRQWNAWSELQKSDASNRSINQSAWDARQNDQRFVRTDALPDDREQAIAALDPWINEQGPMEGRRVLCLAAGGGTHGPLLALAGANVTVVDFSEMQLEIDRRIASQYRLSLSTVQASIDDLASLSSSTFDFVVQPVSTCYVRDISKVYAEVSRVLRTGGLYFSQHKQPVSLQASIRNSKDGYFVSEPADEGHALLPSSESSTIRENDMTEFVHGWDALIGGLCRSGFVVEDLQEPPRADAWAPAGSPEHRARFLPPYVKIKARKVD